MLHIRRYRYFVLTTAIILFLLYRVSQNSDPWDSFTGTLSTKPLNSYTGGGATDYTSTFDESETIEKIKKPIYGNNDAGGSSTKDEGAAAERELNKIKIPELKGNDDTSDDSPGRGSQPPTKPALDEEEADEGDEDEDEDDADDADAVAPITTPAPVIDIPDRKINPGNKNAGGIIGGPLEQATELSTKTTTYWKKVPEHFPVPTESIIPLPTGKPEKIPTIQYNFKKESAEAREKRLTRLRKVEAEAKRAWSGYKKYAWMHDELSPVSKKFRDPFCGWAATLVDSLDTLWIMGMKDEFEDAVQAVGEIDFTTSPRSEIPVFETTIRYLGGLLAAYDVSGGKAGGYSILLDKAVELAEILMAVFDTPNRMPVLYYNWKPSIASRPKRASAGSNLAELGSLSMEFTRLAQLTRDDKYYDAVARITDALYDWQERGTSVPGIFPDRVDASGCNKTAEAEIASQKAAELAESQEILDGSSESRIKTPDDKTGTGSSYQGPGHDQGPASGSKQSESDSVKLGTPLDKRSDTAGGRPFDESSTTPTQTMDDDEYSSAPKQLSAPYQPRTEGLAECVPQGLTASHYGLEGYSMGGGQDSTYEYFPKQYLLLGGLEPKYRIMHEKTVEAVKKWLLFRPMVPQEDRDILFSAKIQTKGSPETDALTDFEVAHLTCFVGGMFGMGGRIFDRPGDVEIAKRLTDGCVWAYESMPSGVMPEGAAAVPCASVSDCAWNETLWWRYLDPLADTRDAQLEDYHARQEELRALRTQEERKDKQLTVEAEERVAVGTYGESKSKASKEHIAGSGDAGWGSEAAAAKDDAVGSGKGVTAAADDYDESHGATDSSTSKLRDGRLTGRSLSTDDDSDEKRSAESGDRVEKRVPPPPAEKNADRARLGAVPAAGGNAFAPTKTTSFKDSLEMSEGSGSTTERDSDQVPLRVDPIVDDPARPQSHKEYVQSRIETERIPPGFSSVNFHGYILR